MNIEKLKIIEEHFFETYPNGFLDDGLAKIVKRHNVAKITTQAKESFLVEKFTQPEQIVEDMRKIISKSSMISLFEKPKFRDFVNSMSSHKKEMLSIGFFEMLHGDLDNSFEIMLDLLVEDKLAKWSIISILPYYFTPSKALFVKPTTTKNILKYFEIENLIYKPRPTYDFYKRYYEVINEMKLQVDKSLVDDNAKFTGFLMMGMEAIH